MDPLHEPIPTEPTAANAGAPERDEKGRFQKGNRGGPGNPFTRQAAKLRQAALNAVSEEEITEVIAVLKAKAKQGDVAAIKLLLSYTVGKPTHAPNPDTLDQHELETIVNNHVPTPERIVSIIQGLPIEALLIMLRAMLPVLFTSKMQMAHAFFSQPPENEEPDSEDEDDEEDEPQATAAAETAAPNGSTPTIDPIPDWMHALVNPPAQSSDHGAPKPPVPPQTTPEREKAVMEIQRQLDELLNEVKKQRAAGGKQPNGSPPVNADLLRILVGRMRGLLDQQQAATPPLGNG